MATWAFSGPPTGVTPVQPSALAPGDSDAEAAGLAAPTEGGVKLSRKPAPAADAAVVRVRRVARREARSPAPDRGLRGAPEPGPVILPTVGESGASEAAPAPSAPQTAPRVPSPGALEGFPGLDDIPDLDTGYRSIPPDTDGAVGQSDLVEALNNNYRFRDKATGATLSTVSPGGFWTGVGGTDFFDPRVLYDPHNDRWLMVSVSDPVAANSSIEVGVSRTSDPRGAWWIWRIDASGNNTQWADFPTVGFNKNWVAINVNMFRVANNSYASSKALVIDYPSLRTGSYTGSFLTGTDFTAAPAITYSTTEETLYMVAHYGSYGSGNGAYRVWQITGTPSSPTTTTPTCCLNRGVAWGAPIPAPQSAPISGASACGATPCTVETNDARIGSAPVFRNGSLYYAQTVGLPYGAVTHTGVLWTRLTATTGAVADGGFIEDPTATASNGGAWYAYPGVAVNADGDMVVGYSRFASNLHPSTGYSIRLSTDAAGTTRDPVLAKAGEDYYHKTFGGAENRWGDYSDAQVDPVGDTAFWTLQEYAKTRVGTDDGTTGSNSSRWGTWWTKVNPRLPGIAWDPSAGATRVAERPRTCNTPTGSCTDSGRAWTSGTNSVAASTSGTQHYVHAVWTTDAPTGDEGNGQVPHGADCSSANNPATGAPPYCSGVAYARSGDGGATWNGGGVGTAPVMLSPGTTHAGRPAVATSGASVHVAYVTTVGYADQMCANAARVLWVVSSNNHGAAGSWGAPVRLTSLTGRVDRPSISASGSTVQVVATDSDTGDIVLFRSTNGGGSFSSQTIGHTQATYDNGISPGAPPCATAPTPAGLEGFSGRPVISGQGATVGASWIRNPTGRAIAKISTDGGANWPGGGNGAPCDGVGPGLCSMHLASAGALGAGDRSSVSAAATSGRVAFAWVDDSGSTVPKGLYVRVFTAANGWGPARLVSCMQNSGACAGAPAALLYDSGYAPSIAVYGTTGLGVAWSACPYTPTDPAVPCDRSPQDAGAEILWKESWNDGATWSAGEGPTLGYRRIVSNGGTQVNADAGVVLDATTGSGAGCAQQGGSYPVGIPTVGCKRYVLYSGQSADGSTRRLYLSIGTQIPTP